MNVFGQNLPIDYGDIVQTIPYFTVFNIERLVTLTLGHGHLNILNKSENATPELYAIYSRTSMARTRRDRRCEFDPSMCSSDTLPDNFQVGSCVLYVITDTTFFIDQSCKAHVTPFTDDQ